MCAVTGRRFQWMHCPPGERSERRVSLGNEPYLRASGGAGWELGYELIASEP